MARRHQRQVTEIIRVCASLFTQTACPLKKQAHRNADLQKDRLIQSQPMLSSKLAKKLLQIPNQHNFFQIVKEQPLRISAQTKTHLSAILIRLRLFSACEILRHPFFRNKPEEMVEVDGIEPTTPCLQSRCSPS